MQKNIIKVLLICNFSNSGIRDRLLLKSGKEYFDMAVWITNRLKAFASCDALEIHVVSSHEGMIYCTQTFEINGIHYYFFKPWTAYGKFIETSMNYAVQKIGNKFVSHIIFNAKYLFWRYLFLQQRRYVKSLVNRIEPDLIYLNGAENPYYSSTVLGLKKLSVPICIHIQGIVGDPQVIRVSEFNDISRIRLEHKIHTSFEYFMVGSAEHYRLIKHENPTAKYMFGPGIRTINIDPLTVEVQKEFDFVFMSRVTPIKGIEHLLKALSTIHVELPEVSLLVLGPVSQKYLAYLKDMCKSHGIGNSVVFAGHVPKRDDLYREALKAKIFVLPTTIEGLATSAVEAMLLGLPVVTYATGGMPLLNSDGENVLMCETGNIEGLTNNMKRLLTDPDFAQELALRGQAFAKRTFGAEANVKRNIRQYRAIIEHYHHGTPIPKDLLYTGA
ncbi:MAG: glycosyltransferase family 4 protein [Proteiniphilum sp.]|nr:glycosyltransferase family 4 protein [Proteiniphilum sp.]